MKSQNLSMIAVGMILVVGIMVSFLVARPVSMVQPREMPVFMGQEVAVQRAVEGLRGQDKAKKAVKAQRAIKAVPQPKAVTPLPLVPPTVSYRVLPEYPVSALEQGLQGTAILSIYVGLGGVAERVEVASSSGVAELDNSAVKAVSQWKFSPAMQGGAAVASWFEMPVRFQIN